MSAEQARALYRECCARFCHVSEGREADGELIARSRLAVSQSFAALAKVPDLSFARPSAVQRRAEVGRAGPGRPCATRVAASWSPRAWVGLEGRSALRFFFDIDDGEVLRRDSVGVVLASQDDVPRETRSILADLAHAALPEGRPRLFTARVRDRDGAWVYEGSMSMRPRPTARRDRKI